MKFEHNNIDDLIDNFDYPKPLNSNPTIYGLLGVFGEETNRLDLDIEHLYDQRFLDTATGNELRKLAEEVGLKRRDEETDEHLRRRIYAEYAVHRSDTTYDQFASAIQNITGASDTQVDITTPPNTSNNKVVDVTLPLNVIDGSPLAGSEIREYLSKALSVDARAEVFIEGTFGFVGDEDNKGFNNGTWSSTE